MGKSMLPDRSLHMETLHSAKASKLDVDYKLDKFLISIGQYLEAQDQLKGK